jgi:hypothetical protein
VIYGNQNRHASYRGVSTILAVGAVTGKPSIRRMMTLTLSSDHRVVDGARAASFLNDVVQCHRRALEVAALTVMVHIDVSPHRTSA